MPRQVDHAGRRRRIAEAVCRLADERGLEGVTLRDVAARAEVSMGAVQRCFRTKEQMLVFALTHVGEAVTARIRTRPAADPRAGLEQAAAEISLLSPERRAEARVWLAFVAQAAVTPSLADILRDSYRELHALFSRLLADAGAPDPESEAQALLALADGLTTHVLIGHLTPETARDTLGGHLRGVLGRPLPSPPDRPARN
ncbi:TetR family transcriptional regulator C-terminal domain-containing protein [Streptomyces sp. MUM 203J]|uniref:TetR/AcrR family transcriptional regulator n=1 Tax=Streptomyces sp. MUM 203J TaxID=2791990 RepID=UPI001F037C27|nr:TetR family transcriptional regulator C-terminal domain-containing protein [Streptomyces sp. MUM 203J]MCH0541965.1 TetR family transcriptional regulator C-terminal domain-containing protein [Streptomyces sp. MUM 203J]